MVTAIAGPAMFVVGAFLIPGPTTDTPVSFDNPLGQPGVIGTMAEGVTLAGLALHGLSLPAALLCVVLRFRSSHGVERQQLRWVATGAAIAVLGVTVPLGDLRGAWVDPLVILCVPLTVAVAVLRYRLWDLDRIISRTVAYALLTLLLGLGYAAVVLGLGRLVGQGSSLAVAAATLAVVPRSRPCAAGSSRSWTGASTGAATTPPAPWRRSRPGCGTRSTWTRCTASCWPWSTRPCSRPGPRCGCAPVRRPGPAADATRTATPGRHGTT
jgi:hypothetical protein